MSDHSEQSCQPEKQANRYTMSIVNEYSFIKIQPSLRSGCTTGLAGIDYSAILILCHPATGMAETISKEKIS